MNNTKERVEENENQNVTPINVFNYVYYYPVYYSLMNLYSNWNWGNKTTYSVRYGFVS